MKEKLGADETAKAQAAVDEGIQWLSAHDEEEKEVYVSKHKEVEDVIRPILVAASSASSMPDMKGAAQEQPRGPVVDEVD